MSLFQRSQSALKNLQGRVFVSTSRLVKNIEQVVGIKEVREAQNDVIKAEKEFVHSQANRRQKQQQVSELQEDLKAVQNQLNKISRGDDRYLDLVTDEHQLLRREASLKSEVEVLEDAERSAFGLLSAALRCSHERERVYGERTKYFSVVGSVAGAIVGAVATGLSGYLRVRQLRIAVDASSEQCLQLQDMVGRLEKEVGESTGKNKEFLDEFRQLVGINSAAILMAGVGEENVNNGSSFKKNQVVVGGNPVPPELLTFMTLTNSKLDTIESNVSKLSSILEEDRNVVEGSVVSSADVRSEQQPTVESQMDVGELADDVSRRVSENLQKYTVTLGTLAFASGVAVVLSALFAFR